MWQVLVLLFPIVYFIAKWRKFLPPGPKGLPIVGYLPWVNTKAPYLTLTELAKKYGTIYGVKLGSVYTIVLTDPKLVKTVLYKDAASGRAPLYLTHGIMNGYGLICAEGSLWKDQRRFVYKCLKMFGGARGSPQRNVMEALIQRHVDEFVETIKQSGREVTIDPLKPLQHSIGSAINLIVFGKSWASTDDTWIWLQDLQEKGTKYIGIAGPLNFLPFLRFLSYFKRNMNFVMQGKIKTHRLYAEIIREKEQEMNNPGFNPENVNNILQAFLLERKESSPERKKMYSDQQFYHLLADVFGAGLDTTLTTLRWFLLYIAKHEEIQYNLRKEIEDVLQARPPSMVDIPNMPLMEAAIAETQRIRPVVPVGIPHGLVSDMRIEGYDLPKGSMVVPLQWAMHMDPTVWPDPENFDPNRFLDAEGKFFKDPNWMPYQIGKRMCVGEELARMFLFSFTIGIVRNFKLSLEREDVDFKGECGITLTPKPHKITFKFKERFEM